MRAKHQTKDKERCCGHEIDEVDEQIEIEKNPYMVSSSTIHVAYVEKQDERVVMDENL